MRRRLVGSAAPSAATPPPARPRASSSTRSRRPSSAPGPSPSATGWPRGSTRSPAGTRTSSASTAASARCARSSSASRIPRSRPRSALRRSSAACSCSPAAPTATCSGCCLRSRSATTSCSAGSSSWRRRLTTRADERTAEPEAPEPSASSPDVRCAGLRKTYGEVVAVEHVDLEVARGEFFTLLGPSGSGKTTTLRLIAGFEVPDAGRIELRGVDVASRPPYERPVNTVFQDYALFPHMTVGENVAYGLRVRGVGRRERAQRADEALEMVRLGGYGKRK